jgi:hypothetical protein
MALADARLMIETTPGRSSAARVRRRAWLKPQKFPHRRTPTETRFAPAAVLNTGWTGALPCADTGALSFRLAPRLGVQREIGD